MWKVAQFPQNTTVYLLYTEAECLQSCEWALHSHNAFFNGVIFKKWHITPASFSHIFRSFQKILQFLQQLMWKNVHPVSSARILTHDLENITTRPQLPRFNTESLLIVTFSSITSFHLWLCSIPRHCFSWIFSFSGLRTWYSLDDKKCGWSGRLDHSAI